MNNDNNSNNNEQLKFTTTTTTATTHQPTNVVKMVETMKDGHMPPNADIQKELDATKDYLRTKERHAADTKEVKTFKDARMLVEATEEVLNEKNPDEQLQRFVKDVKKVTEKATVLTPSGKIEARWAEASEFVTSLKNLMEPLLQSAHFRKTLSDASALLIEILQAKLPDEHTVKKKTKDIVNAPEPMEEIKKAISDTANAVKESQPMMENIPEEQKQRIRHLFKNLLKEISSKPESTQAFRNLLKLLQHLHYDLFVELKKGLEDTDIKRVQADAKDIVERFTGGKQLDNFLKALNDALETIKNDSSLKYYLEDLKNYIEKGLNDPNQVSSDEYLNRGDDLVKRGNEFAHKYINNHTLKRAIDEARALLEEFQKDDSLQYLRKRALKFFDDFTYRDSHGHRHIDMDIVSKMRADFVPFLIERIKEVPIPKIEVNDADYEYLILDDLHLTIDEILPNMINIHSENDIDINVKELKADKADTFVKFKLEGLKPKIKDFYFAFKRRKLIKLEDQGRATITVKGAGIDVYVDFEIVLINGAPSLGSHHTKVRVHKMDVDILEAKHKIMLNIITTLFSGRLEKQVENVVKNTINSYGKAWADYVNKNILSKLPTTKEIQHKIEEHIPIMH